MRLRDPTGLMEALGYVVMYAAHLEYRVAECLRAVPDEMKPSKVGNKPRPVSKDLGDLRKALESLRFHMPSLCPGQIDEIGQTLDTLMHVQELLRQRNRYVHDLIVSGYPTQEGDVLIATHPTAHRSEKNITAKHINDLAVRLHACLGVMHPLTIVRWARAAGSDRKA